MRFLDVPCSRLMMLPPVEPVFPPMPEDPKLRALCRPSNYAALNPTQQKEIDRELNLVGWDGVS